jgi:hypothetical protein
MPKQPSPPHETLPSLSEQWDNFWDNMAEHALENPDPDPRPDTAAFMARLREDARARTQNNKPPPIVLAR